MKRWFFLGLLLLWPTLLFAQSVSGYTFGIDLKPVPGDLSFRYLGNMFGNVEGLLPSGSSDSLLGQMFGVFNGGILVLGGIVVLYTFFIGTLRTAHEGETLGREWSSIWIPLRIVLGISLLIPKSSGYSFIQVLIMWIIINGIGVADSLWNTALNYLYSGGIVISKDVGNGMINTIPMVDNSAKLLRSLTCVQMLQAEFTRYRQYQQQKGLSPLDPPPNFQQDILQAILKSKSDDNPRRVQFPSSDYYGTDGVCGYMGWTDVVDQLPAQLQKDPAFLATWTGNNARTIAVYKTVSTLFASATAITNNYLIHADNPLAGTPLGQLNNNTWGGPSPNTGSYLIKGSVFSEAAKSYYDEMQATMRLIAEAANDPATKKAWVDKAKQDGWALAGAYYFNIVNANKDVAGVADTKVPDVYEPDSDLTSVSKITSYLGGASSPFVTQLQALINGASASDDYIVGSNSRFISDAKRMGGVESYGGTGMSTSSGGAQASSAASGVSSSMGGFLGGLASGTDKNPIVGIATFGDSLVTMSFIVILLMMLIGFGVTIGLGAIPFCSVGAAGVSIVTAITSFLFPLFAGIMMTGLTMSFYIPMIPFILFSFGVIGWFIAVVEAILAAPLVALGISHPEGSHAILGKADPAVALLINVFFRPTFMIFGLIFGMMVTYVGLWLVNEGFGYAFNQATATAIDPFKPLACIIIYVAIAIQIIQKGFSLIHIIPDQVLRWINMRVEGMGGEAEAERAIGESAKAGLEQVGDTAKGLASGTMDAGGAIGAIAKEKKEDAAKAENVSTAVSDAGQTSSTGATGDTGKEGSAGSAGGAASSAGDAGAGAGSAQGGTADSGAGAGGSSTGPAGKDGKDGAEGKQGEKGDKGETGMMGNKGQDSTN